MGFCDHLAQQLQCGLALLIARIAVIQAQVSGKPPVSKKQPPGTALMGCDMALW